MKGKKKRGPVIAIDGPSGVGKTTISRLVAGRLGLRYINTGSMYRALALAAKDEGVDLTSEKELEEFCRRARIGFDAEKGSTIINGKDYSDRIRSQSAGELASIVSTKKPVREFLVSFQRTLGEPGSVVMEGRDIGTAVFPDADMKFFLDAPLWVRAKRRHLEVAQKVKAASEDVTSELEKRDKRDIERANSPLKKADDAIYIDTGEMQAEEVANIVLAKIGERLKVGDIRS
ncbi:MAG: (d)CMP kinase [Deltaproteobacteria bacterium]|nr:(d)CMP kinase [Deltaproteobacteria bacterium]